MLFEGNTEFSAVNPQSPPLLEVNIPIGARFRDNPGDIINRSNLANTEAREIRALTPEGERKLLDSANIVNTPEFNERIENGEDTIDIFLDLGILSPEDIEIVSLDLIIRRGLEVNEDQNVTLLGGNVLIENSAVTARGGRVTIAGLSQAGEVVINNDDSISLPQNIAKSDVNLTFSDRESLISDPLTAINGVRINVQSADGSGTVDLNGRNLTLDGAIIGFDTTNSLPDTAIGDINLTGNSILINDSVINMRLSQNESQLGSLSFIGNSLSIDNSRILQFNTLGGAGIIGSINLTADSIAMNQSMIESQIRERDITVGDINFTADSITMNLSTIESQIIGEQSEAADINFEASSIQLNNNSVIRSDALLALLSTNNDLVLNNVTSGDINLIANDLALDNSSLIISSNFLESNDTGLIENVISFDNVNFGNINLIADLIEVNNQSDIITQTQLDTELPASEINIEATNKVIVEGIDSSISSQTGGSGNSGSIKIDTPKLLIANNAQISANNFIIETYEINEDGLLVRNILEQPLEGSGNAGKIQITTTEINLRDRGGIVALSSAGEGGNIELQVDELLTLENNSAISATAGEQGTPGSGGNININSDLIIAFPNSNSDITTNAFEGNGGNININAEGIFGLETRFSNPPNFTNDIDASSEATGLDGTVDINNPAVDPTTGLINLPASVGDASDQISQNPCQQGVGSQFIVSGKGGLPPNVNESVNSESARVGLVEPVTTQQKTVGANSIPQNHQTNTEVVPAQGWVFNDKGEVTLTAYKTTEAEIERSTQKVSNSCLGLRSH